MWSNERENKVFGGMLRFPVRVRTTTKTLGTTPGDKDLLGTFIVSKAPDAMKKVEELAHTYVPDPGVDKIPDDEKDKMITMFPKGLFLRRKDEPTVFFDPLYDIIPKGVEVEEVTVPYIWDYQIRGSFKESIAFIQRASKEPAKKKAGGRKKKTSEPEQAAIEEIQEATKKGEKFACTDIKSYKKVVDGGWFIAQRRIPMLVPETYMDEMGRIQQTYDENGRLPIWTRPLRADTAQGPRVCLATSEIVPAGTEYYFTVGLLNAKDKAALIETLDFKEKVGMLQWRGGGNGTFIWTPADKDGHPTDEEI